MALDVRDGRLTDLINPEAAVEQIATGCEFTEGPLWHATEQVPAVQRYSGKQDAEMGCRVWNECFSVNPPVSQTV